MTIEAARLSVVVDSDTKDAESGMDRVGGIVGGAGKAMLGAATAAAGFGVAIGGFAIKSAVGLQDAFAPVGTLLGANSAQMGELTSAMKDFVSNSPQSAEDVGMAAYMALSAGITTTKGVTDALASSNQLAQAGLGSLGGSMDLVTSAMNSFKGENLSSQGAAEAFFGAIASGKTTTDDLAQGFGQIAPLAAGAGVKFNDLLAATAALTSTGESASTAYAGIRGALSAIIAPTSEASATAAQLGLDFSQAHLAAVGLPAFLDEVKTATGGNVTTMASLFGGVEGLNTVMSLTGPQSQAFAANLTGIGKAGQNLSARATEMESTTSNRFAEMKNKVIVALGGVGEKIIGYLLPKFEQAQQWVSDHWPQIQEVVHNVMQGISDAWDNYGRPAMEKLIEVGTQVVGWVVDNWPQISATIQEGMAVVRDVITTVWAVIKSIWDNYGTIILGLVKTVWTYISDTVSAVMGVIKGVINVVMGLINGDWDKAWKGIKQIFTGIWDAISAYVGLIIGEIKAVLSAAWVFIKDAADVAWSAIKGVATAAWNNIKDAIMSPINAARDLVAAVWDTIKTAAGTAWDGIKTAASTAWNVVKDFITSPIEAAKDAIAGIWSSIVGTVTGLPGRIASAASGMWDGIKNAFKSAINWIIKGWNSIEFKMPSFDTHIPGVGTIGGFTIGLPDIPLLHGGGMADMSVRGDEVLRVLKRDEMVLTAGQQRAVSASMGGGGSVTHINVGGISVTAASGREELAGEEVVKAILRYERDSTRVFLRANESRVA